CRIEIAGSVVLRALPVMSSDWSRRVDCPSLLSVVLLSLAKPSSSNGDDVCVSFVSLKPHDTCHLGKMAGRLQKIQNNNREELQEDRGPALGMVPPQPPRALSLASLSLTPGSWI
ncbi:hypothetical protein KUCAC02_006681, partial [Chaenocephalus aceratus]